MVMTNPDIRALHHYNVEVKKLKKMKSIMKLCGKVARMLVGLRARTRSVRKTDLHPLVRCDEGMKGHRPVETWE
jgi:hypothetical protein